jgi:hypothetical protein
MEGRGIMIDRDQCVPVIPTTTPGSEFVKESDRKFQITNCEFTNAFEIRFYIHS